MKNIFRGVIAFIAVIIIGITVSIIIKPKNRAVTVMGAVGGGKENFLADPDILAILHDKYNINLKVDNWSNNKLIKDPIETKEKKGYDFVFFSDERFYEYYKKPAAADEAPRIKTLKSHIVLSTPIVVYSWDSICDTLISKGIVEKIQDTYYIVDMPAVLSYIENNTKWSDIGIEDIYGKVNIASTDPVTSSPGATYYGLLASIMNEGYVDESNISNVLPKLKDFYKLSGFMNNTPADLFDLYLRMGKGAYPMIVDYEKSIIDFANNNPGGFSNVKDKVRILYPNPTIWNSHCIMSFTEGGTSYVDALADPEIQKIAWEKYGFRTGVVGGEYDVNSVPVKGIPQEITSATKGLQKEIYDQIIEALKD
jgi:hypothetical protein